jgi:hypothetical protein
LDYAIFAATCLSLPCNTEYSSRHDVYRFFAIFSTLPTKDNGRATSPAMDPEGPRSPGDQT